MEFVVLGIAFLCLCNAYVCYRIKRNRELDSFQKNAQIILVWVIPLVGFVAMWTFIHSIEKDDNKGSGSSSFDRQHENTSGTDAASD